MTEPILTEIRGGVGYITLNRPDALHALNLPMCKTMLSALRQWRADERVHMVLVDHADGTRGFCAGGDIAMLARSGKGDGAEARAFFAEEYRLNAAIKAFPKPYLAIMDGITMGGGVGLSVHGSHRVATERTVFAMPETGIGLFPDVGGGWFLPRLAGELGTWLALTGTRLKGGDVAAAGIATHYMPSELIGNLKVQIRAADFSYGAAELLGEILSPLNQVPDTARYVPYKDAIDTCFVHDRVKDILEALGSDGSDWAHAQIETIRTKSPETVKLALRQLREGRACETFEQNMQMEYRIGWRKVQSPDFIEGVRAVIFDKDNDPKWSPPTLEKVNETDIDAYFAPLGDNELNFDA